MKIVFMGTPDFAAASFSALLNSGNQVIAVFTGKDKPKGRGHKLAKSPVKELAEKHNIEIFQPDTLKADAVYNDLKFLNPDLIVVSAYGKILPKAVLELPKYGCINVHASLLPKYRGAAPIQWAIINGEKETGITIMQMGEGLDTGDILYVKKAEIKPKETSGELFGRLSILGGKVLLEALDLLKENKLTPLEQDDANASYAPMITKELSNIDWSLPARKIHNLIYGLQPWPCAQTSFEGNPLKIFNADIVDDISGRPGEIILSGKKMIAVCGDHKGLSIHELQLAGSKRLTSDQFLCGHKIKEKTILPF